MALVRRYLPVLLFALLAVVPIWRAVLMGQGIGPFDQIRTMAPWNGPTPTQPWDLLQADGVLQFYPWRYMVLDAWGKGQLPLWNPYQLAGTPLLANSQSAGFYPPHILLGLLHVPTVAAITMLAWFHLFWAGLGTYFFSKRLGASKLGAAVGGSSFALSPFMLGWTALASVISTVAWIPWILACITAIFTEYASFSKSDLGPSSELTKEDPHDSRRHLVQVRAALSNLALEKFRRRQIATYVALAASVGMVVLAGHLQFVAYGMMAAVILTLGLALRYPRSPFRSYSDEQISTDEMLVLQMPSQPQAGATIGPADQWRFFARLQLRRCLGVLLMLAFGLGLAAPQLLPVLQYSQFSHRRNTPTSDGYNAYIAGSIKPFELASLGVATALGNPREVGANVQGHPISTYWTPFVKQGANFAESAVTIGPLVLALLVFVPWRSRSNWTVAALGIIALMIALGTPINALLYYHVPGWSASGSPGRIVVLFVLCACVLAAQGVDRLAPIETPAKKVLALAAPLLLSAIFAFGAIRFAPEANPSQAEAVGTLRDAATGAATIAMIVGALLASIALATHLVPEARRFRYALVAMPLVIAWTGYASNLVTTGEALPITRDSHDQARYAFVNDAWDIFTAQPAVYPPNTPTLFGLHDIGGYDSLLHRETVDLLHQINGGDPAPLLNGNMMFTKPGFDPGKMALAGVTKVVTRQPIDRLSSPDSRDGLLFYTLKGPGRASITGGHAEIVEDGYDRELIDVTSSGGLLFIRDRRMPGWHLASSTEDLPDLIWRTVDMEPGSKRVVLRYDPPGLKLGLELGAVAWLVLAGLALQLLVLRRNQTSTSSKVHPGAN